MTEIARIGSLSPSTIVDEKSGNKNKVSSLYTEIIKRMLQHAQAILEILAVSGGKSEMLTQAIQLLHSLTNTARQYQLHACIKYAIDRGDLEIVQKVMQDPLLQVILMYINNVGINDPVYLDWKIGVVRSGIFRLKSTCKIGYELTNVNPYEE